jgi:hypothetical protein
LANAAVLAAGAGLGARSRLVDFAVPRESLNRPASWRLNLRIAGRDQRLCGATPLARATIPCRLFRRAAKGSAMAVLIRKPAKPIAYAPRVPTPRATFQYAKSGAWIFGKPEGWESIANHHGITNVWNLILYNFQCRNPEEVNWCMQEFLQCTKSNDGKNFSFDPSDKNPIIFIPPLGFEAINSDDIAARTLVASVLKRPELQQIDFRARGLTVDANLFKTVADHIQTNTILCSGNSAGLPTGARARWFSLENVMLVRDPAARTLTKEASVVHEAVHAGHDALKKGARTVDGEVCAYTAEMIFSILANKLPLTFDPFDPSHRLNDIRRKAAVVAKQVLTHRKTKKTTFEVGFLNFAALRLEAAIWTDPIHGPEAPKPQGDDGV